MRIRADIYLAPHWLSTRQMFLDIYIGPNNPNNIFYVVYLDEIIARYKLYRSEFGS